VFLRGLGNKLLLVSRSQLRIRALEQLESCFINASTNLCLLKGNIMPRDSHQRAAEFHEMAAHSHRAAAVHHGKEDHLTGHEHSRQAMEHAAKAFQYSREAHEKSEKAIVKEEKEANRASRRGAVS
jgi:hypothetical protein